MHHAKRTAVARRRFSNFVEQLEDRCTPAGLHLGSLLAPPALPPATQDVPAVVASHAEEVVSAAHALTRLPAPAQEAHLSHVLAKDNSKDKSEDQNPKASDSGKSSESSTVVPPVAVEVSVGKATGATGVSVLLGVPAAVTGEKAAAKGASNGKADEKAAAKGASNGKAEDKQADNSPSPSGNAASTGPMLFVGPLQATGDRTETSASETTGSASGTAASANYSAQHVVSSGASTEGDGTDSIGTTPHNAASGSAAASELSGATSSAAPTSTALARLAAASGQRAGTDAALSTAPAAVQVGASGAASESLPGPGAGQVATAEARPGLTAGVSASENPAAAAMQSQPNADGEADPDAILLDRPLECAGSASASDELFAAFDRLAGSDATSLVWKLSPVLVAVVAGSLWAWQRQRRSNDLGADVERQLLCAIP